MSEFIKITGVDGELMLVSAHHISSVANVTDRQRAQMQAEKGYLGYDYTAVKSAVYVGDTLLVAKQTVDEIFDAAKRVAVRAFVRLPALFGEDYLVPVGNITDIASYTGENREVLVKERGEEFSKINAKVTFESEHSRESILTTLTLDEIAAQLGV